MICIEYKGFCIIDTIEGYYHLLDPKGKFLGEFCTEEESRKTADEYFRKEESIRYSNEFYLEMIQSEENTKEPESEPEENSAEKKYFVYKLHKLDKNVYSNYRYWNGSQFKYNAANILLMTYSAAKSVIDHYKYIDGDTYSYNICCNSDTDKIHHLKKFDCLFSS